MTGKLYGTLGPACADTDTLRALLRAGMRGVRLNLSHGPLAERAPWLESLRRAEAMSRIENVLRTCRVLSCASARFSRR